MENIVRDFRNAHFRAGKLIAMCTCGQLEEFDEDDSRTSECLNRATVVSDMIRDTGGCNVR